MKNGTGRDKLPNIPFMYIELGEVKFGLYIDEYDRDGNTYTVKAKEMNFTLPNIPERTQNEI